VNPLGGYLGPILGGAPGIEGGEGGGQTHSGGRGEPAPACSLPPGWGGRRKKGAKKIGPVAPAFLFLGGGGGRLKNPAAPTQRKRGAVPGEI